MSGVEQWATYADAARIVRVPEATIRWWVHRGRKGEGPAIRTVRMRHRLHVDLHDVRVAERDSRHASGQS